MLYVRYYMYALLVYILLGSLLSDRKIQTIRQVDGKRLGKEMTGTGRRAPWCSHPERPGAHLHSIKTARVILDRRALRRGSARVDPFWVRFCTKMCFGQFFGGDMKLQKFGNTFGWLQKRRTLGFEER